MCIIINKPKGVAVPDSATIKQCWAVTHTEQELCTQQEKR